MQKYYSPEEISKMIEIRKKELSFPETVRYDALSNRLQKENMWLKYRNILLQIDKESLEKTNIILEETIHHKKNPPKILEKPTEEID